MPESLEIAAAQRAHLIKQQIRPWGVVDPKLIAALERLDRARFVPIQFRELAYFDTTLLLSSGQCLLEPKVEAKIVQALAPKNHELALVIGNGTGFIAAVLGKLCRWVYAFEQDATMASLAQEGFQASECFNCDMEEGDLEHWPQTRSFDLVVVAGGVNSVPKKWLESLNVGGRLATFVGSAPLMQLTVITRVEEYHFSSRVEFDGLIPPLPGHAAPQTFSF